MWRRAARGLAAAALLLAVLTGAEAHAYGHRHAAPAPSGRTWPCSHAAAQSSPEVLQLLRKTGNAFKQVGDILLKKTGAPCAPAAAAPAPVRQRPVPVPSYSVYPHPYYYHPYYPMPSGQPPMYPVHYMPAAPVQYSVQAAAQQEGPVYPAELSNQLVSLASEYEQAAQNECSCGNVEVNMRQGPSSLASGKASDIVVEVTLGDLTQAEEQQQQEQQDEVEEQKKTVNILSISEASEGGEVDAEAPAGASSSASVEEKTVEETEDTHTIQVVEAIKLQPETSPLQVETFDNTVNAVEKTIKETVVVKSETEETKTIFSDNGETVINVKTFEESFPKTSVQEEEEIFYGGDEADVVEEQASVPEQPQHQNSYDEKVEVVEVEEETLEELKKEASVVSEIVETVDIEQKETEVKKTVVTETKTVTETETVSKPQEDVKIVVVDVEANTKQNATATQTATGDAQYFEYDYEYVDVTPDCVDNDAKDLQKYFPSSPSKTKSVPKYASESEEKESHLNEGEHLLAERPHPVENVQVVVKGTSAQAYAEGLQVHSAATTQQQQQQAHSTVHYHQAARAPQPAPQPKPKPAVVFDVPCEAHYGIPKPGHRQRQSEAAYKSHKINYYPAPVPPQPQPWPQPKPSPQPWPQPECEPEPEPEPEPTVCTQVAAAQAQPAVQYQPAPQYVAGPPVYYERPTPKPAPQQPSPQYVAGPPVYYVRPTPKPAPEQPKYVAGPPVYRVRPIAQPVPQPSAPQYIAGPPVYHSRPTASPAPQPSVPQYIAGPPVYYSRPTAKPAPQQPSPQYIAGPPVYYTKPTPEPAPQQPQYIVGPAVYYARPTAKPVPQQPTQQYLPGPAVYYAPQQKTVQTKKTVTQYETSAVQPAYSEARGYSVQQQQQQAGQPAYYQPAPQPATYAKVQPGQGLHHRQQQSSAQEAASRILLGAVQDAAKQTKQSSKVTPAQYPPYYFTSHSDSIFAPPIIKRPAASARVVAKPAVSLAFASTPAAVELEQDSAEIVPQRYASEISYQPAAAAPVQSFSTVVEESAEEQPSAPAMPSVVTVDLPVRKFAAPSALLQKKPAVSVQSYSVPAEEDVVFDEVDEPSAPLDVVQLPSAATSVKVEKKPVSVVVEASKPAASIQSEEDLFDNESNAWTDGQSDAGDVVDAEKYE